MKITICDICGDEIPTIKFVDDNIKDLNFCISSHGKIWDICDKCRVNLNKWIAMQRKESQKDELLKGDTDGQ